MLSKSPGDLDERKKFIEEQCLAITKVLILFLPDGQEPVLNSESLSDIFREAADLAQQIRLSPQPYQFVIDFRYSDFNRDRILFETERAKYRIINAANGQAFRDSDIVEAGYNGRIGKKLCVVHPALVRKGEKEGEDVVLTKATILASLDKPIGRPPKAVEKPKVEVKIEGRQYGSRPVGRWFGGFLQG